VSKVYLLWDMGTDYDEWDSVIGVFASLESAKAWAEAEACKTLEWTPERTTYGYLKSQFVKRRLFEIDEQEVQP
jgi:hypothetical protein